MGDAQFKPGFVQQHGALLVRSSRLVDAVLIVASLRLAVALHGASWGPIDVLLAVLMAAMFQIAASGFGFYRSWRMIRLRDELAKLLGLWLVAAPLTSMVYVLESWELQASRVLYAWFVLGYAAMVAVRLVFRMLLRHVRSLGYDHRRVAFAGCNAVAKQMGDVFAARRWMGIDVVGFFDDRMPGGGRHLDVERDGSFAELLELARRGQVHTVYVCLPMAAEKRIKSLIDMFARSTVSVYYCPSFFGFDLLNARWDDVFGQPVVSIVESPFVGQERWIKRAEDLLLVLLVLPFVAVPMLLIAAGVALTSPGPVFFRQNRYGLEGRSFRIWKFRTMYKAEEDGEFRQATVDDDRVTPLGRLLRRSSLDELPQIFNVICGDMSFVGPRPHPVKLDEAHRDAIYRYMLRHKVKPGITGLAQVSGYRGETSDTQRMVGRIEHDLTYIRSWSVFLDIKILMRTALTVLAGENAH